MKRLAAAVLVLAFGTQAEARSPLLGPPAQYYGPLKNWHGAGYKEDLQKDGSWRVLAESRPMDGESFARHAVLRRAAEIARDQGHAWVQILGGVITIGTGLSNRGQESAKIFVLPVDSPDRPAKCKWKSDEPGRCYTASVAEILTMTGPLLGLSAPARPAFAMAPPPPVRYAPPPRASYAAVTPRAVPVPATKSRLSAAPRTTFEQRLQAATPVVGRHPTEGWTVSD